MVAALHIGNQVIKAHEIIPLIAQCQIMPNLMREMIINNAIARIDCTGTETERACQQFYQQHQITDSNQRQVWLQRYGMTEEQLVALATRLYRIEKFKEQSWGHKLASYFLQRKSFLDKVVYSLIRTQDSGIAQEIYYRIQAGEQTFAELAPIYSVGAEANTNGIVGPIELGNVHPSLARQLQVSQPGKVWHPLPFGDFFAIVRLEQLIPARLDEFMRQRLLGELFEDWLLQEIHRLPDIDKSWLIAHSTPT